MAKHFLFSMVALTSLVLASGTGCAHKKAHVETAKAHPAPAPPPKEEPKPAPVVDTKIVLPGELEFEASKAVIMDTEQSRETLEALVTVMKDNPKITKLRIEGHTDSSGKVAKNQKLSQARAEAVAKWLVAHDIDAARISSVGLGHTRPLVENDTLEHRAQNRRTEFHLQEVDGKAVSDEGAVTDQRGQVASSR